MVKSPLSWPVLPQGSAGGFSMAKGAVFWPWVEIALLCIALWCRWIDDEEGLVLTFVEQIRLCALLVPLVAEPFPLIRAAIFYHKASFNGLATGGVASDKFQEEVFDEYGIGWKNPVVFGREFDLRLFR